MSTAGRVKLRIVVADDNPHVLDELVSCLKTEFEVVATATDGDSAVNAILLHEPDVAVLDLMMPAATGIEVTRRLMSDRFCPAIVICSVETAPEIIACARQAGALGYVFK